jgi:flagellar basal body rod protein FlgG
MVFSKTLLYIVVIVGAAFAASIDPIIDMAGSGMDYAEKGSEINMENVVNAKTPGFRFVKQVSRIDPKTGLVVPVRTNYWGVGPIVLSGRNLDASIEGRGFFVIRDNLGRALYTRDGRFEMNADHILVSVAGKFSVLSDEMQAIEVPPEGNIKLMGDGSLVDPQGVVVAKLAIMDIDDYKLLHSLNNVLFYLEGSEKTHLSKIDPVVLRPGSYESSNVEYSKTLARMANSGKYTANTNLVQTRLKMMDTMIDIVNKN